MKRAGIVLLLLAGCEPICFRSSPMTSQAWEGEGISDVAVASDGDLGLVAVWTQGRDVWARGMARTGGKLAQTRLDGRVELRGTVRIASDGAGYLVVGRGPLDAGGSRAAVRQALDVAWAFNVITRLADAFEFEVGNRAFFDSGAKMLLTRGYK